MEAGQWIADNVSTVALVLGFGFSVYYNIKNNSKVTEENKKAIQELTTKLETTKDTMLQKRDEMYTQAVTQFTSTLDKMLDVNKSFSDSIRRLHEKHDDTKAELLQKVDEVKEDFVSHKFCDSIRSNEKGH